MKIALIEASHWHVPLYLDALSAAGAEVVAVSDRQDMRGPEVAGRFGSRLYNSYESLLENERIDFAFTFGRHSEMPRIGEALVRRGIPFAMEKPCGVTADDVARLRRMAEGRNLYAAVPFVYRVSGLLDAIRNHADTAGGGFPHLAVRNIAGPPDRYLANGSPWMLDPEISGGGCTINLAVHFIDLARVLTGQEVAQIHGRMSGKTHGAAVEDYSVLTLTMADASIAVVETGYTFAITTAEKREFTLTASSASHYVRTVENGIRVYDRVAQESRDHAVELDTDRFFAIFVERVLSDFRAGRRPVAGLADAEAVMRVVDAGYASGRSGCVVALPGSGESHMSNKLLVSEKNGF